MNTKTNQNRTWLILLLLLLVVAGFVQSVVALEPKITVFSDDFNAGDFKVDWTVTTTGAGSFDPSTAKYVSEPYSVYMDSMGTSRASAVSPVYELDLNKDYYVSFYLLIPDSGNHWFEVFNNHQIYLVIDSGTQLKCYLGNNNSLLLTDLSTDHWYHIEIITKPSSSNYDVYIDGDLKRTCPFWIHTGFEDCFQIGDREGTSNDYGEAYWDDFLITQGTLIRVDCGATGNNDGTSWADAFTSLQDGLDRAVRGDRIWVAAGTYKPTYDYGLDIGDRGRHFRMKNEVGIYGGFPATGDPGWLDRDPNTFETILSGDIGTVSDNSDNCYHVFYHPEGTNLDPNAVLDGFTITGGKADDLGDHYKGGGMYNYGGSPTLSHCIFIGNSAISGGGMFNVNSHPTVSNSTFSGNSAEYGGGMINGRSSPTVTNCTFSRNEAYDGGGIFIDLDSNLTVTNCTFSGNQANQGNSLACDSTDQQFPSTVLITNCVLWDGNDGIWNNDGSTITINYSDVQGGFTGTGNIDADPLFVDDDGVDNIFGTEDDNLHLKSYSPCINKGKPLGFYSGQTDMDGEQRVLYDRVDMGADEVYPIAGDFEPDEDVDAADLAFFINRWLATCSSAGWCDDCDIDMSEQIDLDDFAKLATHWLNGTQ